MKSPYKLILYSFLIYFISIVGVTYWYISDHLLSSISSIQTQSIKDIVVQIGIYGALIPVFTFLVALFLIKKVKSGWLLSLLLILLVLFVGIAIYGFILKAIFHTFDSPILYK